MFKLIKHFILNHYAAKFLRLAISLGLLAFVLTKIDFQALQSHLSIKLLGILLLALALNLFNIVISAAKLRFLLQDLSREKDSSHIVLRDVLSIYFSGVFFNIFLPTNFGGDGVKGVLIANKYPSIPKFNILSAIFLERFSGLLAITSLFLLTFVVPQTRKLQTFVLDSFSQVVSINSLLILAVGLVLVCLLIAILVLSLRKTEKNLKDTINTIRLSRLVFLSLLFQFVMICNNFMVFSLITHRYNLLAFWVLVPLTILIITLPISSQGIGIRDVIALAILPLFFPGVSKEEIVLYTLILNMIVLMSSAIGGIVYAHSHLNAKHEQ